ncbi:MAG: oligosaccharide flippase family protein [Thermoanaerobaculia bacterium]
MTVARTTARAAVWAFLATAGGKAVTLLSLVLLARLLAPREFGLLAFAMAYMTYVEAIGDLGSGMALVYWPDRREEASQVTFLINALAGVGWCVVTLALAPAIADFFHATDGAPIVRVLAFSFIIKFLGNTHDALLQKDLRFRARMLPELALAVFKAIVALILAWFGFGAWSLVWGHIVGLTVRTAMVWIAEPWRPSLTWPRDLFRPMLDYGRGIIAVNVLAAITHHADLAVVGRFLGTTALGLYQMAGKVPETSVIIILWVASKVLFPAFARIHATGESLRRAYLMATKYLAAITIPAAAGLILLSKPIVLLFFGAA